MILPSIYKFNGVTELLEIPDDIKTRYQWRCVTRVQLDEDTQTFLRLYPLDQLEGVTQLLSTKNQIQPSRRSNGNHRQSEFIDLRIENDRRIVERPFSTAPSVNKRFRADLNHSYPGANRTYGQTMNHNSNHWSTRPLMDDQRQQFFERSNYELRSIASNNHRDFHPMTFNNGMRDYPPPPSFGAFAGPYPSSRAPMPFYPPNNSFNGFPPSNPFDRPDIRYPYRPPFPPMNKYVDTPFSSNRTHFNMRGGRNFY